MSRGDELVELLGRAELGPDANAAANQLLKEFYAGYSVERLRVLLGSANPAAANAGAWILAELGDRAAPLLDEVPALLRHQLTYVRFFALQPILVLAGGEDGELIAAGIALLSDPETAVRQQAMDFLVRLTPGQLAAGRRHTADGELRHLLEWLEGAEPAAISARLADDDRLVRWFAGIAAVRVADVDRTPLELAATSADEDVATLARHVRDLPVRRR